MSTFAITINRALVAALGRGRVLRLRREEGQTFVEYALILSFIAVALTASLLTLQGKILPYYDTISNDVGAALP
jgi:Flp pilus assembly pilin Flp